MSELVLVKSSNFGNVKCDFWQNDTSDILMTREQIGLALEYSDPRIAIYKIHERHKDRLDKYSVVTNLTTTDGKTYQTYLYNSKGVMEICRWSQQPKADAFMDWVWEVVESIRKHGAYMTPQKIEEVLLNPDTIIQLATELKKERERRLALEPKAEAYDTFMDASNLQPMNDVAKCLGIGRNKLFALLREKKIIRSNNTPYQEYIDRGYFEVKEKPIKMGDASFNYAQTFVTAKGVDYISKLIEKSA